MFDEKKPILVSKKSEKYKDSKWIMYYFINPNSIVFKKEEIKNEAECLVYSHKCCKMCEFMRCNDLNCLKRLDESFINSDVVIYYSGGDIFDDNKFIKYLELKFELSFSNETNNFECPGFNKKMLLEEENEINLLSKCRRFVIMNSFKINFKPIRKRILLTPKDYLELPEFIKPLIYHQQDLSGLKLCYLDRKIIRNSLPDLKSQVYDYLSKFYYDFTVYPYYDIVMGRVMYVLKYKRNNKTPLVRLHSIRETDSIIPLRSWSNYSKWKKSLDFIIKSGHGYVVLVEGDGKGYGLPAYFVNENKTMSHIGLNSDNRDFEGSIALLNDICLDKTISILYSTDKERLTPIFEKYHFNIQKWFK